MDEIQTYVECVPVDDTHVRKIVRQTGPPGSVLFEWVLVHVTNYSGPWRFYFVWEYVYIIIDINVNLPVMVYMFLSTKTLCCQTFSFSLWPPTQCNYTQIFKQVFIFQEKGQNSTKKNSFSGTSWYIFVNPRMVTSNQLTLVMWNFDLVMKNNITKITTCRRSHLSGFLPGVVTCV